MTGPEVSALVGSLGFPIFLVLVLLWIGWRAVWPWFTKYMADRAVAQDARHARYLAAMERSNEVIDKLVSLITRIDVRLEDHTKRLTIIEAAARAAAAAAGH